MTDTGDKALCSNLSRIIGYPIDNLEIYKLALRHTSMHGAQDGSYRESNERLEYLGDAILGALVAEHLFKKYPYKDEGFLTEIRSRMVNRQAMNDLAIKTGMSKFVQFDGRKSFSRTGSSIYGDAMEALVGAVYLDLGYIICRRFVIDELIRGYFDLEQVVSSPYNFKSKVIEWSQKEVKKIRFEVTSENGNSHNKTFECTLYLLDEPLATGMGYSKKKAEQAAAEQAWKRIQQGDLP